MSHSWVLGWIGGTWCRMVEDNTVCRLKNIVWSFPGSLLLDNLIAHVISSPDTVCCKALYLHALTTNVAAITFYERKNFKPHSYLPSYYSINGELVDGFSYVLYVNNGFPPWSVQYPLPNICSWPLVLVRICIPFKFKIVHIEMFLNYCLQITFKALDTLSWYHTHVPW